eukprot:12929612-Prorocentrum_lima.AAC.1
MQQNAKHVECTRRVLEEFALRVACDHEERCRMLLAANDDGEGQTALHLAALNGHEMAIRALRESAPNAE